MSEWKDIPDFEGLYQANTNGEIRSVPRVVYWRKGFRPVGGVDMVQRKTKFGYLMVHFRKDGKSYYLKVHRVIALTFIQNPQNKPAVNHKDGDKNNNHVSNLEWCTNKENSQHASKSGLLPEQKKGSKNPQAKSVIQMKDGVQIKVWGSIADAAIHMKVNYTNISSVARGVRKSAKGFQWKYLNN